VYSSVTAPRYLDLKGYDVTFERESKDGESVFLFIHPRGVAFAGVSNTTRLAAKAMDLTDN